MMRLPFIHRWAAGLAIIDDQIVWASGVRLGRRLRWLTSERQPMEGNDVATALDRMRVRIQPALPYVAVHLDPLHVRHAVLQGPVFDEAASFEAWLESEAERQLPPRARLADFVLRVRRLEETEEYTRCLMALASRKAVEERVAVLEGAGFLPLRIGSLDVAVGEAVGFDPQFFERALAVLVVRGEDAALLQYQEGVLQSLLSLPYGVATTGAVALLQEAASHLTPLPDRLFVAGTDAQHVVEQAREAGLLDGRVQVMAPWMLPDAPAAAFPTACLPAAALMLQELFPASEAFNFLEPDVVEARLQEIEKREAARTILTLGSMVGALFLLVTLCSVYLDGKKAATEAELAVLADQVARIEQARVSVQQWAQDLAQAERLVVERTNVAGVLDGVGRVVTEGMWLEGTRLEGSAPGASRLTLTGAAFDKSTIAAYLDSLEQASFARNVRLLFSESVRAATMYKQAALQDRSLTRFEIQLDLSSRSRAEEAP